MSKLLPKVLATVACLAALAGCRPEQAPDRSRCLEEGLGELVETRWVEPRLSGGFAWERCEERLGAKRLLGEVICPASHNAAPAVSRSLEACDEAGKQHLKALQRLTRDPNVDEAITTLTALTRQPTPDPRVWSDLAGAFMVQARQRDRPSDLLRAVAAARKAVAVPDPSPEALFNLALAEELLQLPWQAARTWAIYLGRPDDPRWVAAGRNRRDRLGRQDLRAAATVWPLNRLRLPEAVRLGDRDAVAQLVTPFPGAAQRYVEEEVLPAWARTPPDAAPAQQHLKEAQEIADAIARTTGDRYLRDVVEVIAEAAGRRPDAVRLRALAKGHVLFGEARQLSREIAPGEEERYQQAAAALGAAGSPLRASAEISGAAARFRRLQEGGCSQVLDTLAPLDRAARQRGYGPLLARLLWVRALCLSAQGRLPDAFAAYAEALTIYRRLHDREGAANIRARMIGVARDLGEKELAWRHAWLALRDLGFVVETWRQHYLLGEAAETALALGEPEAALLHQGEAIRRLRRELEPWQREDPRADGLRRNLGIALHKRATILIELDPDSRQAQADMQESILLLSAATDEDIRNALLARFQEAEAKRLLAREPLRAISLLNEALRLYPRDQFSTYRANLHFLLARAYRRTRDQAAVEEALKAGIKALEDEEKRILEWRRPGEGEALWGPYFSRFGKAYQQLVRLLTEQGKHAEAFAYAERARAFEPLDLVLRLGSVPREFERLAAERKPLGLADLQEQLPAGTFLLDYYLLDQDEIDEKQLVVWIVWRGGFAPLRWRLGRSEIQRWAEVFQAAKGGDSESFVKLLDRVFVALVRGPLERLTRGGRQADIKRLVFIPDGPINGLPLAALRDRPAKRHLVEDFPIEVAPSATLYVFSLLRDRQLRGEPASALLVGNPTFDTELESALGLEPLEWASREVAGIGPLYRPLAEVLESERATVDDFLHRARAKSVIHFAGHAVANPDAPSRSVLLLAPSAAHSGALTAEELLSGLELEKTRLVVLSACSSAGGGPIGPSGLAPLVRPFLAGGVPAVVGTLWNVRDAVAAELLESFHNHLAAGEDAAGALRKAQLEVIRKQSSKAELVLVWAPFQVVGHASSPFPPN